MNTKFHLQFGLRVDSPVRRSVCSSYILQQRLLKKIRSMITDDHVKGYSCGSSVTNKQNMYHSLENRIIHMNKNDLEFSDTILEEEGIDKAVEYIRSVVVKTEIFSL